MALIKCRENFINQAAQFLLIVKEKGAWAEHDRKKPYCLKWIATTRIEKEVCFKDYKKLKGILQAKESCVIKPCNNMYSRGIVRYLCSTYFNISFPYKWRYHRTWFLINEPHNEWPEQYDGCSLNRCHNKNSVSRRIIDRCRSGEIYWCLEKTGK